MPRLKALNRYWQKHPPVHLFVAAYLDYEAPAAARAREAGAEGAGPPDPRRTPWMAGMGGIPASDAFREATTAAAALAAAERMFYGNVKEI
jgi:hypothetical protein